MGYGIEIFVPRPLYYVTRSPGIISSCSNSSHNERGLVCRDKNRDHFIKQVKKLGYERRLVYKQPRRGLGLCGFSFARYSEKCFTQISVTTSFLRCLILPPPGASEETGEGMERGGKMRDPGNDVASVIEFCH